MAMTAATKGETSLANAAPRFAGFDSDVCLVVEGCYPYIRGGVSSWVDWLMRSLPHLSFSVVALWPQPGTHTTKYDRPPNLVDVRNLYLQEGGARPSGSARKPFDPAALTAALLSFVRGGGARELGAVDRLINPHQGEAPTLGDLLNSREAWEVVRLMYEGSMPQASFLDYFWAWRALFGGLFATLKFPLPRARVYHTISTGYAGIVAARATVETGRPALITEHGIYTNERRIEILMADWIADTVEKGLALHDPRFDLRDMWTDAFEAYARACYEASSSIITLYGDNQLLQRNLGAKSDKLKVIPNGMDWQRFASLRRDPSFSRPTVALIGRVVPIKDVKTFISAVDLLRGMVPDVRALIMGPTDEDPEYFEECRALVGQLGMSTTIEFTGAVAIGDWLPQIDVVALTSLSEAQPLVLLEAGAAAIPCVATNVGSCAEILLGHPSEAPNLGQGGIITDVVASADIARAVRTLLCDEAMRRSYGGALRQRVRAAYSNERAVEAYRDLYDRTVNAPTREA